MREIKLTQGKVALVDDSDFDFLNQYKWYARKDGKNFYANRHKRIEGKLTTITMHGALVEYQPGTEIDHKDGNGLNNQRSNLRLCTRIENQRNSRPMCNKTHSRFKGVSWNRRHNRWRARVTSDNITISLGCFETEIEAAIAYDQAAKKLHGEFARTNFGA